jgi:hypothetical protein
MRRDSLSFRTGWFGIEVEDNKGQSVRVVNMSKGVDRKEFKTAKPAEPIHKNQNSEC